MSQVNCVLGTGGSCRIDNRLRWFAFLFTSSKIQPQFAGSKTIANIVIFPAPINFAIICTIFERYSFRNALLIGEGLMALNIHLNSRCLRSTSSTFYNSKSSKVRVQLCWKAQRNKGSSCLFRCRNPPFKLKLWDVYKQFMYKRLSRTGTVHHLSMTRPFDRSPLQPRYHKFLISFALSLNLL